MQKAIRIGIIVAICGLFIGLACYNSLNPAAPDMTAWNENMTLGNKETAKHHFVMYTDISSKSANRQPDFFNEIFCSLF